MAVCRIGNLDSGFELLELFNVAVAHLWIEVTRVLDQDVDVAKYLDR